MKRVYDYIEEQIITAIKEGTAPWQKPWDDQGGPIGANKRRYRGVANVLSLTWKASVRGYTSPHWMTFNQIRNAGGKVMKGEKGTPVEFWKPIEKEKEDGTKEKFLICKVYWVFNREQTDLPVPEKEAVEEFSASEEGRKIVRMIRQLEANVSFGGDSAHYAPATDSIRIPNPDQFTEIEGVIPTIIHELVHWTMKEDRLNRDVSDYAFEELVAEAGAFAFCMEHGLPFAPQNHSSYLASWASKGNLDEKKIREALSQANKAVRFLGKAWEQANPESQQSGSEKAA